MHDWMNVDTFNRLTHFKQFFKECFQLDYQSQKFVENEVFSSDIFRLLPFEFRTELEEFVEKVLQQPFNELSESAIVAGHTLQWPEKKDKLLQQLPVLESISLPETYAHFETKNANELLVFFIDKRYLSVQFYDPQRKSWHSSPVSLLFLNKLKDSFQHALLGSMLYAFGGGGKYENPTNKMWSRDLSDPSSQWTARANMKQSRKQFCSVVLNDTIYALGGRGNNNEYSLRSCERYCSQLNEWSTVADMNCERASASAAVIDECIYVAGGKDEQREVLNSVCKYCPETDTWREVAQMTTQRSEFSLTPFAGRLWAIGGRGGDLQLLSSCESYDPVTDTWREEEPMKEGRYGHAAIEFNGKLYVVGGCRWFGKTKLIKKFFLAKKHFIKLVYIL